MSVPTTDGAPSQGTIRTRCPTLSVLTGVDWAESGAERMQATINALGKPARRNTRLEFSFVARRITPPRVSGRWKSRSDGGREIYVAVRSSAGIRTPSVLVLLHAQKVLEHGRASVAHKLPKPIDRFANEPLATKRWV